MSEASFGNFELVGPFHAAVTDTHEKFLFRGTSAEGVMISKIFKVLPVHTARAEVMGAKIFQRVGLRVPETELAIYDNKIGVMMEDLSGEFVPDQIYGGVMVEENPRLVEELQQALLPAILIGDYDRVPWNSLVSKNKDKVAFVDFGACLGSRARGGYNGFLPLINAEEIWMCVADPYNLTRMGTEAFKDLLDFTVEGDKVEINIKNPVKLSRMVEVIKNIDDLHIDEVVESIKWPTRSDNLRELEMIVNKLKRDMQILEGHKNGLSVDHKKTSRALITYEMIRDQFEGDFADFYKYVLKRRRDDLIRIFSQKNLETIT